MLNLTSHVFMRNRAYLLKLTAPCSWIVTTLQLKPQILDLKSENVWFLEQHVPQQLLDFVPWQFEASLSFVIIKIYKKIIEKMRPHFVNANYIEIVDIGFQKLMLVTFLIILKTKYLSLNFLNSTSTNL